jgi:hypothetical protein
MIATPQPITTEVRSMSELTREECRLARIANRTPEEDAALFLIWKEQDARMSDSTHAKLEDVDAGILQSLGLGANAAKIVMDEINRLRQEVQDMRAQVRAANDAGRIVAENYNKEKARADALALAGANA